MSTADLLWSTARRGVNGFAVRATSLVAALLCCLSCRGAAVEGLVAAWDFDAGQGETLRDRVGSAHGTIHGATWVPVGTVSMTVYFHADGAALPNCKLDCEVLRGRQLARLVKLGLH